MPFYLRKKVHAKELFHLTDFLADQGPERLRSDLLNYSSAPASSGLIMELNNPVELVRLPYTDIKRDLCISNIFMSLYSV